MLYCVSYKCVCFNGGWFEIWPMSVPKTEISNCYHLEIEYICKVCCSETTHPQRWVPPVSSWLVLSSYMGKYSHANEPQGKLPEITWFLQWMWKSRTLYQQDLITEIPSRIKLYCSRKILLALFIPSMIIANITDYPKSSRISWLTGSTPAFLSLLKIKVENLLRSSWSRAEVGSGDGQPVMLLMKPRCSEWLSQTDIVLSVTLRDAHVTNRSPFQIPPWGTAKPLTWSQLTGKSLSPHTV